ncbi:hypothetical protein Nepgr_010852 [Nepenthes gracilis]|uniref:Bifunctional inhibitor/plant lipid transfer protein/seed storage helical domain-containing protein n=1 Tax=Nepenthes gracilis TaxID=150966 RepID=A0AAD3XLF4_NEPGR|nr:hypothetical protein Nepgr_010852 [Nepenthes gracilis]
MAAAKSLVSQRSKAALPLMLIAAVALLQVTRTRAQSCTAELTDLNVCAPFVVPGANGSPTSDCCGALQSVHRDCLCDTLRIASRLPSMCNLPPITCGKAFLAIFLNF